jgi:ABC-2 type transport system ATP-binding protein
MSALTCVGLGKRYGGTYAVQECSLDIPSGRVVAMVGPNGAGKTTLLHLSVGLARPSEGHITVLDDLAPGSTSARERVAFVAQDAPLYPGLTVLMPCT